MLCPPMSRGYILPLPSCLLIADMWKDAASLGTCAAHAGWYAAVARATVHGVRAVLTERRAAERGAVRARFRRASIVCVKG